MKKVLGFEDITDVQVAVSFGNEVSQLVPLTAKQAGILFRSLGFRINPVTGILEHFTDKELADIYDKQG